MDWHRSGYKASNERRQEYEGGEEETEKALETDRYLTTDRHLLRESVVSKIHSELSIDIPD